MGLPGGEITFLKAGRLFHHMFLTGSIFRTHLLKSTELLSIVSSPTNQRCFSWNDTRPCQYETQTHDVHLRKCLKKMLWASQDWWLHCQCHTQDGRGNPFLSNTSASLWMGFPEVFVKLCDYVHVQKMNFGVPHIEINLVGGFNPSEKYDRQIGSCPQVEVINKKNLWNRRL